MLRTLQDIRNQQQEQGAALAPKIDVYKHRTTLYGTLEKLISLEAIQRHEAPNMERVSYTFTITEFGETMLNRTKQAGMIN